MKILKELGEEDMKEYLQKHLEGVEVMAAPVVHPFCNM